MPFAPDPATAPEPLLAAVLLSATAGVLDAVTYLLHGHVFATAMTGNSVLLGLTVLERRSGAVLLHAAPLLGYVLGLLGSKLLRRQLRTYASPAALLFEATALVLAGFLPLHVPAVLFVGGIAFVSAVQVAGFRRVGPYVYNSTFLTGDLREVGEGLFDWIWPGTPGEDRARARDRVRDIGLVFAGFLAGAVLGALASRAWQSRAYWLPVPLLIALAPASLRWARRQNGRQPTPNFDADEDHAI